MWYELGQMSAIALIAVIVLIVIGIILLLAALYYGAILYGILTVLKWFGIIHLAGALI